MDKRTVLRVVMASPSDVAQERAAFPGIVDEVNREVASERGLYLEPYQWETDAYPGFHPEGPQGLIDEDMRIEDCDILIGVFWKRLGTPTPDGKTGTEHEFWLAYEAWKKNGRPAIMVYFNQQPYEKTSEEEKEQAKKLDRFKKNDFPAQGFGWEYNRSSQFENLARRHLSKVIRKKFPITPNGKLSLWTIVKNLISSLNAIVKNLISSLNAFFRNYWKLLLGLSLVIGVVLVIYQIGPRTPGIPPEVLEARKAVVEIQSSAYKVGVTKWWAAEDQNVEPEKKFFIRQYELIISEQAKDDFPREYFKGGKKIAEDVRGPSQYGFIRKYYRDVCNFATDYFDSMGRFTHLEYDQDCTGSSIIYQVDSPVFFPPGPVFTYR